MAGEAVEELRDRTSQTRAVPSSPPVARRLPSGENAAE